MTLSLEWRAQLHRAHFVFGSRFNPTVFDGWNPEEQWRNEEGEWVDMPDVKADTDVDSIATSGEKAQARKDERAGKKPKAAPKTAEPVKATTTGEPADEEDESEPGKPRTPVKRFDALGRARWDKVPKGFRKGTAAELRERSNKPVYSGVWMPRRGGDSYALLRTDGKQQAKWYYSLKHHVTQERAKWARVERFRVNRNALNGDLNEGMRLGNDTAAALRLILETGMRPGSEKGEADYYDEFGKKMLDKDGNVVRGRTYGANTLEGRHIIDNGDGTVTADFIGKNGKRNRILVEDERLVADLKRRAENAGPDGQIYKGTDEKKMNKMLADKTGGGFTNKDLRTVWANVYVRQFYDGVVEEKKHQPRNQEELVAYIEEASLQASEKLGNTHDTFKNSYMSMMTFYDVFNELFPDGDLEDFWEWGMKLRGRHSMTAGGFPKTGPVDLLTPEQMWKVYNRVSNRMPPMGQLIDELVDSRGIDGVGPEDAPPLDEDDPDEPLFGDFTPLTDLLERKVPKRPPLA